MSRARARRARAVGGGLVSSARGARTGRWGGDQPARAGPSADGLRRPVPRESRSSLSSRSGPLLSSPSRARAPPVYFETSSPVCFDMCRVRRRWGVFGRPSDCVTRRPSPRVVVSCAVWVCAPPPGPRSARRPRGAEDVPARCQASSSGATWRSWVSRVVENGLEVARRWTVFASHIISSHRPPYDDSHARTHTLRRLCVASHTR